MNIEEKLKFKNEMLNILANANEPNYVYFEIFEALQKKIIETRYYADLGEVEQDNICDAYRKVVESLYLL